MNMIKKLLLVLIFLSPHVLFAEFELLKSEDPSERSREARRLGNEKVREAVPALIELLKDEVTGPRINAIVSLGKLGDESVVEPLIDILNNDPVEAARAMAAKALSNFDNGKIKNELSKAADSGTENVRSRAVISLGKTGGDEEVKKLIEKVKSDESWCVREAALDALVDAVKKGKGRRSKIKRAIKKAQRKDTDTRVKKSAEKALEKLAQIPQKKKKKKWIFF